MLKKLLLLAAANVPATPGAVSAWGAAHVGYTHVGPNGVYHEGRTVAAGPNGAYSTGHAEANGYGGASYHAGYGYGSTASGGAAAGGYRYGTTAAGGAAYGERYGYVR